MVRWAPLGELSFAAIKQVAEAGAKPSQYWPYEPEEKA